MNAAKWPHSLTGPERASERGHGFRAVGVAVSKLGAPIVGKRGGGLLVRLKTDWPAIVGADWAAVSWPTAVARDGCLKLRTTPAAALELQHRAPRHSKLFVGCDTCPAVAYRKFSQIISQPRVALEQKRS